MVMENSRGKKHSLREHWWRWGGGVKKVSTPIKGGGGQRVARKVLPCLEGDAGNAGYC